VDRAGRCGRDEGCQQAGALSSFAPDLTISYHDVTFVGDYGGRFAACRKPAVSSNRQNRGSTNRELAEWLVRSDCWPVASHGPSAVAPYSSKAVPFMPFHCRFEVIQIVRFQGGEGGQHCVKRGAPAPHHIWCPEVLCHLRAGGSSGRSARGLPVALVQKHPAQAHRMTAERWGQLRSL
jgi:hypothetical protein